MTEYNYNFHAVNIDSVSMFAACCILVTHFLIQTKFHYLPDSVAVVLLGKMFLQMLLFTCQCHTEAHKLVIIFF